MAENKLNQILGTKNSGKMTLVGKESGTLYDFPFINGITTDITAEDAEYAYANGKTKKVTFTGDREGSLTFKSDLYTAELLSFVTGSPIKVGETEILKTQIFNSSSDEQTELTLDNEATKVLSVDVIDIDGIRQESLQAELSSTDKKKITVTVSAGKKVKVFYLTKVTGAGSISIKETQEINEAFTAYIDVISVKSDNKGGGQVCLQIICPNARPKGELSLELDGSSISQYEFNLTLTPDEDKELCNFVILAEE